MFGTHVKFSLNVQLASFLAAPLTPCARRVWAVADQARSTRSNAAYSALQELLSFMQPDIAQAMVAGHPRLDRSEQFPIRRALKVLPKCLHPAAWQAAAESRFLKRGVRCLLLIPSAGTELTRFRSAAQALPELRGIQTIELDLLSTCVADEAAMEALLALLRQACSSSSTGAIACRSISIGGDTTDPQLTAEQQVHGTLMTQCLRAAGTSLQELRICGAVLLHKLAPSLAAALPTLTGLQKVTFEMLCERQPDERQESCTMRRVAPALQTCTGITRLTLAGFMLDSAATLTLVNTLRHLTALQDLELPQLHMKRAAARQLDSVSAFTALTRLHALHSVDDDTGFDTFAQQVARLHNVRQLAIGGARVGALGLLDFAVSLESVQQLTSLMLHTAPMPGPAYVAPLVGLTSITTLRELRISGATFNSSNADFGSNAALFGQFLRDMSHLETLGVEQSAEPRSASLMSALKDMPALRRLELCACSMSGATLERLGYASALTALQLLDCWSTCCQGCFHGALVEVLPKHAALQEVEVCRCGVVDAAARELGGALAQLSQLRRVLLCDNELSERGVAHILLGTAKLQELHKIEVQGNDCCEDADACDELERFMTGILPTAKALRDRLWF